MSKLTVEQGKRADQIGDLFRERHHLYAGMKMFVIQAEEFLNLVDSIETNEDRKKRINEAIFDCIDALPSRDLSIPYRDGLFVPHVEIDRAGSSAEEDT